MESVLASSSASPIVRDVPPSAPSRRSVRGSRTKVCPAIGRAATSVVTYVDSAEVDSSRERAAKSAISRGCSRKS
ncbi:hypothetical protein GCM10010404_88320 [Nonomuraea africana]